MLIMFPSDYFNIKKVDPEYAAEYDIVCQFPEYKILLFNYDEFVSEGTLRTYPRNYYKGDCIYRGWMLKPEQYKKLYDFLRIVEIRLINSPAEYVACHLFPEALPIIKPYTPKCLCFEQGSPIDWELINRNFTRFMIKDFVKSVKGTAFPAYFETPVDMLEMENRVNEFIKLRDNLFTGGIILKEYIDLKKYNGLTNEYRVFFIYNRLLSCSRNSCQPNSCTFVPEDFQLKFSILKSNYYTVDFGELEDGTWMVIETGDG